MAKSKSDPRLKPLTTELGGVAKLRLAGTFKDPTGDDTTKFNVLAHVIQTIEPERWGEDPTRALIVVMRRAVGLLPKEDYPQAAWRKWRSRIPWREIGELFFGFRTDVPPRADGKRLEYGNYLDEARARADVANTFGASETSISEATFYREVRTPCYRRLATILLDLAENPPPPAAVTFESQQQADKIEQQGYINRPEYEDQFAAHLQAGARIFLLHGDAGTGKTTLARQFALTSTALDGQAEAAQSSRPSVVEIDTRSKSVLIDDLRRVLYRCGIEIPLGDVIVREVFRDLLASPQSPYVAILDNVEQWDDIKDLIPVTPQGIILITSRVRFKLPYGILLSIGEMTDSEATAMVSAQRSEISDEDAGLLASDLSNRPLAIRHACGFLSEEAMTVTEFRDALGQSIAKVLDTLVHDEQTLTAIYRLTIERFADNQADFGDALHLIDLIAAVGGNDVSYEFLQTVWSEDELFSFEPRKNTLRDFSFKKAFRILENRCLVEERAYFGSAARIIWMHSLTTDLLAELREQSCTEIRNSLLAAVENAPSFNDWPLGKTIPIRLASQTPGLYRLLGQFTRMSAYDEEYPHLAHCAAVVAHGETQNFPDQDAMPLSLS